MMTSGNIVLISFTGENASGGVPRWIRDFKNGFPEAKSYSWKDTVSRFSTDSEWDKAEQLNKFLIETGKIKSDDVVIVDGFWGLGLEDYKNVISVCHGIWSHLIKEEADAGKEPDFPLHHEQQVKYRKEHLARGGRLVAVSQFIQHQMNIQWGFNSTVINNAINLEEFKPTNKQHPFRKALIIHGINDKGNENKGWKHIEYCFEHLKDLAIFMSLDEAHTSLKAIYGSSLEKYEALAMADAVLIPSAYEGNSYFALECLASDVPVITYDVGLFYEIKQSFEGSQRFIGPKGIVMNRKERSESETLNAVSRFLSFLNENNWDGYISPREIAKEYSIKNFHKQWKDYLKEQFGHE